MQASDPREGALHHAACPCRGRPTPAGHQGAPLASREHRRAAEAGRVAAMDRFVWTSGLLEINETLVIQQRGVRVYDGEEKVGRRPPRPAGSRLGRASSSALGCRPRPAAPAALWTAEPGRGPAEVSAGRSPGQPSSALWRARHRNAVPTLLPNR